jgi:hypothetical protein
MTMRLPKLSLSSWPGFVPAMRVLASDMAGGAISAVAILSMREHLNAPLD